MSGANSQVKRETGKKERARLVKNSDLDWRSLREKFEKTIFGQPRASWVLRRAVPPSVIYTVPGTIYHAYNETLTRRQNAAPLIFHVVSPGTRAVTAPSRGPRLLDLLVQQVVSTLPFIIHLLHTVALPFDTRHAVRAAVHDRGKHGRPRVFYKRSLSNFCYGGVVSTNPGISKRNVATRYGETALKWSVRMINETKLKTRQIYVCYRMERKVSPWLLRMNSISFIWWKYMWRILILTLNFEAEKFFLALYSIYHEEHVEHFQGK